MTRSQGSMPTQPQRSTLDLGINYDWWARRLPDTPPLSDVHIAEIAQADFHHIRLPLNPKSLGFDFDEFRSKDCDRNRSILNQFLQDRVPVMKKQGIGLVLTIDATDDKDIFARLAADQTGSRLEAALECLASTVEGVDSNFARDHIIVGNFNEPRIPSDVWNDIQSRGLSRVARRHPNLFFLATAPFPTNIDMLLKTRFVDAANVGYEFHFYEPFPFTHQGLSNQAAWLANKTSVSLPNVLPNQSAAGGDCSAIEHTTGGQNTCVVCTQEATDEFCKTYMRTHGAEFGPAYLRRRFQAIADWAKGRYIYIGEFGVNKGRTPGSGADAASRTAWFKLVSEAARHFSFGRSVFELACGMGVSRSTACSPEALRDLKTFDLDPAIIRALH